MKLKLIALVLLLIPALALAQESPAKKKAYFFYGDTCPHCKKVEAYFQESGIYDKYEITSLEFSDPFNTRLLLKFGDAFNDPAKGAVPAIAFDDKFIVGDQPIIDNFVKEIDASNNSYELPDPDKIANAKGNKISANDTGGQQTATAETAAGKSAGEGNKKNYFPVIIIALAILAVGALVYINRKKE
ncbi:MAG TPA: hypothetical protein VK254_00095 [Candidatus Bathyarchaeia archaeon]|nr:hypothetical protein [Candidatus Bathyarchaeia archaeon]